jgi:hypothetical protein
VKYQKARYPNLGVLSSQYKKNEEETQNEYDPFRLLTMQHYTPLYSGLFNPTAENQNRITLDTRFYFHDLRHVTDATGKIYETPIFIKFSPLLDPIRYLISSYDDVPVTLPFIGETTAVTKIEKKVRDVNNSSYVDGFFNFLNGQLKEHHNFFNGLYFYGSFLCIQDKYKFNITDDLEYLVSSKQFVNSCDTKYTIERITKPELLQLYKESQGIAEKEKLCVLDEIVDLTDVLNIETAPTVFDTSPITSTPLTNGGGVGDLGGVDVVENIETDGDIVKLFSKNDKGVSDDDEDDDAESGSDGSSLNYTTDEDAEDGENGRDSQDSGEDGDDGSDEGEDGDGEDGEGEDGEDEDAEVEEEEQTIHAYIKNFPIQMICLEKCDGTLDELFERGELDEATGSSALFQIVMILVIYQASFNMTHNDLHTNNVMYMKTNEKYVYYYYGGKYYKVPTFGRIYKIIDFGRAIFSFGGNVYCSDSFAPKGDAHTQYNCEPFYNPEKKRIEPNPSFDLCRLGVSIYDFIIDDDDEENPKKMDAFQQTIFRWCHDDNGKNVLYKSDGSERYPNFSLYKMLSRTVHKHVPKTEIRKNRVFSQYCVKPEQVKSVVKSMKKEMFINVDRIPCYA